MVEKLKSSFINISKGIVTPLIVIFIFSLAIGLFLSLTLLIVSIEEGIGNLTDSVMSMTWAVFMFAQGVGLTFANCVLTIVPLGLTILLIAVLASLIRRVKGGSTAYSTGLITWVAFNVVLSQNTHVTLVDSPFVIALKTALVYLLALFIAVFPSSIFFDAIKQRYKQIIPEWAKKNARIVIFSSIMLLALYALVAVITVIVWSCTNFGSVNSLFVKLGMQNGSRILTTIACFIWLPNIAIWALSWICGAGFSIGKVASFTLVATHNKDLPPVPIFGIFPNSIVDVVHRTLCYGVVPFVCFVLVFTMILYKRGCGLHLRNINDVLERKAFILNAVEAVCVSVGVSVLTTIFWTVIFACANGSIGEYRLASVGVNVIESTRAIGHLTLFATGSAFLFAIFVNLIRCGFIYVTSLIKGSKSSQKSSNNITEKTVENSTESADPYKPLILIIPKITNIFKSKSSNKKVENKRIARTASSSSTLNEKNTVENNKQQSPVSLKKAVPRTVSSKAKRK